MKNLLYFLLIFIVFSNVTYGQEDFESAFSNFEEEGFKSAFEGENSIVGNIGTTTIGNQTFIGFRIQPEFSFGKFGLGLDIPLLFDIDTREIREEEYENGVGVLRMIRYFSYGKKKRDAVYVKLGDLTGERLGFGALLGNYTNSTSFERRKVGISADLILNKQIGLEALYSDLNFDGSQKLLALRPYYRPFGNTIVPIVNTLEFGASYLTDKDSYEEISGGNNIESTKLTRSGNTAYGVDLGVYLIKNSLLDLSWDAQYAILNKNEALGVINSNYESGSGFSTGLELNVGFLANVLHVNARIERQWYGDNYIPQFYNFAYEINKDNRLRELIGVEKSKGIYGRLGTEILSLVKVEGELILPDNFENSDRDAVVGINLQTKEISNIRARGKYLKAGLNGLDDAFKLDEKSLANLLVTYSFGNFFEAGVDYQWTFASNEDGSFKATSQVRPYVGININF